MRGLLSLVLSFSLVGCGSTWDYRDEDGDGVSISDGDCNDSPDGGALIGPAAQEVWYDGVDQNCDGLSDFDQDGDGVDALGYADGGDCWDGPENADDYEAINGFPVLTSADVYPGADDIYYDGVDANCDGLSDFDQDGDGFDSATWPSRTGVGDDCLDSVDDEYPASGELSGDVLAPEVVYPGAVDDWYDGTDANCDGENDYDQDGDGYALQTDCDDEDDTRYPDETIPEIWYDGIDQNCDTNDGDQDGDGYYDAAYPYPDLMPEWYDGDDCWDDPAVVPDGFDPINGYDALDAEEVFPTAADRPYDGIDGDCANDTDFDADADGYDSDTIPDRDGVVGDDCDDDTADVYPGASDDWYDGVDADCAGNSDYDADGDGFDSEDEIVTGADCDDARAAVNPDATEACATAYDDDCDGELDAEDAIGCTDWYHDGDGDGYGSTRSECWCDAQPDIDYDATVSTDCNDSNSGVSPAATEVCDASNTDEDCDGAADNNDASAASSGKTRFYHDVDEDGFGDEDYAGSLYCDDPSTIALSWSTDHTDCDDGDADTYVGAPEVIDDLTDQDCDGKETCYVDDDVDGYRSEDTTDTLLSSDLDCTDAGEGQATDPATDCDETDANINPGETEVCDGADVDENCNGTADDDDSAVADSGKTNYYHDTDADGYGTGTAARYCDDPSTSSAHWSTLSTDCNDASASISPAATEICDSGNTDEDCDGTADNNDSSAAAAGKTTYYRDVDSDGYGGTTTGSYCDLPAGYSTVSTDCNDTITGGSINPGAQEICDSGNTDEDCDGTADNNDSSAASSGKTTYYLDGDSDGYGGTSTGSYCDLPSGYTATSTDCNDSNAAISPSDSEICDSANTDEDCDGLADNNDSSAASAGKTTYYLDSDSDGYGGSTTGSYCDLPTGYTATSTDCNDSNAAISPGDAEICDSGNTDEDCDGNADNNDLPSTGLTTYYLDGDSDGYGGTTTGNYCDLPTGYTATSTDCNDSNAAISPGDPEICDSGNTDEDCDGLADNNDSSAASAGKTTYYLDGDSDGYGGSTTGSYCDLPSGYIATSTDCDDSSASIHPGGTEVCDASNADEDCDGNADNNDLPSTGLTTYYLDGDSDGYGGTTTGNYCDLPTGYRTTSTDCNDANAAISPGDPEICDAANTDEDCDGLADNNDLPSTGLTTYYVDGDNDGYGGTSTGSYCDVPSGYEATSTDCNDSNSAIHPGAADPTDGDLVDDDCDDYYDEDGIGAGDLVITEYFVAGDAEYEWFEVYNNSGVALRLDGWTATLCRDTSANESAGYTCDSVSNVGETLTTVGLDGVTLAAGDYLVLCNTDATFLTDCDVEYSAYSTGATGLGADNGGLAVDIGTISTPIDDVNWWTEGTSPSDDNWPTDVSNSVQFSAALLGASADVTNDDWSSNGNQANQWCVSDEATYSSLVFEWATGYYGSPGAENHDCN